MKRLAETNIVSGDTLAMATYDAATHALYDSLIIVNNPVKGFTWRPVLDLGKDIPENLDFTPAPGNKKDQQFAERIRNYRLSRK